MPAYAENPRFNSVPETGFEQAEVLMAPNPSFGEQMRKYGLSIEDDPTPQPLSPDAVDNLRQLESIERFEDITLNGVRVSGVVQYIYDIPLVPDNRDPRRHEILVTDNNGVPYMIIAGPIEECMIKPMNRDEVFEEPIEVDTSSTRTHVRVYPTDTVFDFMRGQRVGDHRGFIFNGVSYPNLPVFTPSEVTYGEETYECKGFGDYVRDRAAGVVDSIEQRFDEVDWGEVGSGLQEGAEGAIDRIRGLFGGD